MKLYKSTTSPYARLAHAMLIESGAAFEVDILNPWANPERLVERNPARRVPVLELDDGTVIAESWLIATHARETAPGGSHLKTITPAQYEIAGRAFGALEAAVHVMVGRKIVSDDLARTDYDSHPVARRRFEALRTGLTDLDAKASALSRENVGLAEILVVDAVDYMDFRFPDADWRPAIPNLDAFVSDVADRPSVRDTRPS